MPQQMVQQLKQALPWCTLECAPQSPWVRVSNSEDFEDDGEGFEDDGV
jgi:hypothetical protein